MHNAKRIVAICLVLCMLLSVLPVSALAVNISAKPENGTTKGQPFAPGTGGSRNFRIPGIATLDSGRVVATIDARWSWLADAGGIDTMVSVSDDNGANWTYTFANYLGDNGNVANNQSCCFIDPAIATDGTTLYMIADLYPAGFAINSARYYAQPGSTGFDANGRLLLRSDSENNITFGVNGYETGAKNATYGYYLSDGKIYTTAGAEVEGYTVDAYFNITGNGINTNLFFGDSPYKPFPTDFLYLTTSTDGLTWSEPELLDVKAAEEQSYLVGPGNGTYDAENDRMIFTAYRHTGGASGTAYECASLIWMDGEGNWKRSEDCTTAGWSSEASSVVLADGTVRVFYRDGYNVLRYTDMLWDEASQNYVRDPKATEVTTTAAKKSGCQLTSILYSERIDGKEVILVACAANPGERKDGHLYVFLVNEDKSMDLAYDYDIFPGEDEVYAYNCITELNDGRIALLYENQGSQITYHIIDMEDVLIRDNDPNLTVKNVELLEGYTATFTDNSGWHKDAILTELDPAVATVELTGGETVTNAAKVLGSGANIDLDSCQYTFTKGEDGYFEVSATTLDGETVYLNHYSTTGNNIPNVTSPAGKIAVLGSDHENMFKLQAQIIEGAGSGAARGLHFHMEASAPYWDRCGNDSTIKCHEYLFRKAAAGETSSDVIPGYVMITSLDEVVDGAYLIAAKNDAGNWYVLNPSTSGTSLNHVAQIMGSTTVGYTEITFTGVGAGNTEVVIGSTLYKVTVHAVNKVELDIPVGESKTVYENSGNYVGADISGLDQTIATVTMSGIDGTMDNGLSLEPVSELVDGTYVIVNTRANKLVTNAPASAAAEAGAGSGLLLNGSYTAEIAANAVWTITKVDGGYTLCDANGKYMTISSNNAGVSDSAATVALNWRGSTWTISENGAYLNHFGGGSSTCAAGWQSGSAAGDEGSQFALYTYSAEPRSASTEITFTGVAVGSTEVLIGRTIYTINVNDGTVTPPVCEHKNTTVSGACKPSCEDDGYTGDTWCLDCEKCIEKGELIPALGHDYKNGKCERCGDLLTSEFEDVKAGKFYFDAVEWAVENKVTEGMPDGTFAPDKECTRGQVVTFLWRAAGSPAPKSTEHTFTDVKEGKYYYEAMLWAVENGITKGMTATTFAPDATCTRAQVVTFLWRAKNEPKATNSENPFTDVTNPKAFYYEAMLWAVENEITTGINATTFAPDNDCTRGHVVTFLYRAYN